MFKYDIINETSIKYDYKIVDKIFEIIDKNIEKSQKGILNIIFVNDEEIKKLNNDYRQKDYVTDVLSFHYYDNFENVKKDSISGELIFNENKIKFQAIEYNLGLEKEFYKLLIHSVLHILGYDHENDEDYIKMQFEEDKIWKLIF